MDLQDTRGGIIGEPESKVIKPFDGDLLKFQSEMTRIVPATGKIYDLTHADTNEHTAALPSGYPANTKAIHVKAIRAAGTGSILLKSVTGGDAIILAHNAHGLWFRAANGSFYYELSVANDDWNIYATGYITG